MDVRCNVCRCKDFVEFRGRGDVRCRMCKSIERTRLLWMYLETLEINASTRVLHLAPERGIYNRLRKMVSPENCLACDFDPARYPYVEGCQKIDLCEMEGWPSNHFDVILHSHVMEHVPCNIAYPLFHLHRMLKPKGRHVCVIPFMDDRYEESFRSISDEERKRRFGQHDHMRRFGRDDLDAHLGKLLKLPAGFDARNDFGVEALQRANIPQRSWNGWQLDTVLVLSKYDMRLLPQEEPSTTPGSKLVQ